MTPSLPDTMHYIALQGTGTPEVMVVQQKPLPIPQAGEVLIKVAAAGINRADIFQRKGFYPPPAGASPIMGLEVSGTIVALGSECDPQLLGRQVCVLTHGGGYAEYAVASAALCLPIPDSCTLITAAALPEVTMTVWYNLMIRGQLQATETVLIHGGSSGIGSCAVQMAHALGCRVIATAGNEEKCAAIRSWGADLAINYREHDFVEQLLSYTNQQGANVILDMVGGSYTERNIRALAQEGRLIHIAWQQGAKVSLDLAELSKRRAWITGSLLRPLPLPQKQQIVEQLQQHLWPLYQQQLIHPVIDQQFPYQQVVDAHRYLEQGKHIGKLLLTFG